MVLVSQVLVGTEQAGGSERSINDLQWPYGGWRYICETIKLLAWKGTTLKLAGPGSREPLRSHSSGTFSQLNRLIGEGLVKGELHVPNRRQ